MRVSKMRLEAMYDKDRPLVFGHRGAMAYAPMNTIAAFELAIAQGSDGIELDVWLSQDDIPVVMHDFDVNNTTDGEGRIGSMPFAELKQLDAGRWFDEKYAGERIPSLDEVFETVGQKTFINVEIKSLETNNANIVYQTIKRIKDHNMQERVFISSFNPFVLRNVRKAASDIPIGFLRADDVAKAMNLVMLGTRYEAWHPHYEQITAANIRQMKQAGRRVNTWTVNDPADAVRLRELGVDAIITNKPDVMLEAFGK